MYYREEPKNVLVMISTHGTWGTTRSDKDRVKELISYFKKACLKARKQLKNKYTNKNIQLYLGYDGDGIQSSFEKGMVPPTLLFCFLIDTLLPEYQDLRLVQCQNNYMGYFSDILKYLNNFFNLGIGHFPNLTKKIFENKDNINIYHYKV